MSTPDPVAAANHAQSRQVFMQRIYLKDASLEMPNGARAFTKEMAPQIEVQVGTSVEALEPSAGLFQVVLQVTITAKHGEETAFLVEVHQAGIFQLVNFSADAEIQGVLGAYCPNVLLPFAREAVASFVQRTGFPPVLLQPINFDAIYAEHLARSQGQAADGSAPAQTVQ